MSRPPRRGSTGSSRSRSAVGRTTTVRKNSARGTSARKKKVVAARPAVSRGRVITLMLGLLALGGLFGWRLVDLQLTPDAALAGDVGSQVRHEEIAAPRGEILDRYGRAMALSLPRPSIVANPRVLQSTDLVDETTDWMAAAINGLAPLLSTDAEVLRDRLGRDKAFVYLDRQVDPEIGDAVAALGLPGIFLIDEQRREHPNGSCSGLGVIGSVDVDQIGVSGLERDYDELLTGTPGSVVRQSQAGGAVQIPGGYQIVEAMQPGADLWTTLDRNIQYEAEALIADAVADAEADHGLIIAADPATGEILAMANAARDDETGTVDCTTTNLGSTWAYEPGSIMKPLTFASVFENDAWPEFFPIDIPHRLRVELADQDEDHYYRDRNVPEGGSRQSPSWVLRKSSNNGTILMAQELGPDAFHDTLIDFGLGETTALELSGEARGILDELDSNALELSNAAIGQGIAVTPLQMLLAYNALGNGGLLAEPSIVIDAAEPRADANTDANTDEIAAGDDDGDGDDAGSDDADAAAPVRAPEPTPADLRRVVSGETADTVVQMMRQVVLDGTGVAAAVPGYDVAGKTGTAWQPCEGGRGYVCADGFSRAITASFAGLVGNDDGAALSIIVVIDNPRGDRTGGGEIAAPVFSDLASYALRQLRIPPSTEGATPNDRVRAPAAAALDSEADSTP